MNDLILVIGNKNLSSWSFRPWILLKQAGVPFREVSLKLFTPEYSSVIEKYSPSKKVPVLHDGDLWIWDSLSISEYIAEKFPQLWPKDPSTRAKARSVSAEMHSGFTGLRSNLGMNFTGRIKGKEIPPEALKDIDRIIQIWTENLQSFGGPFLFGKDFTVADAFYAPVVSRFITYDVNLPDLASQYVRTISGLPAYKEWEAEAAKELESA
ncbi:glutathione S-transferase [Leptospira broomii serovar Hurstbridge str. 5399]|uniref:Glutathione S-transferase n=1 Tax=Leptospira broomii serovar Hurstbridge str. 5399 TaxID=1049789 RepID=T0GIQ2_9LEPT|nr:glutathione S-transferase family protein [Leptospira broomii]EQA45268.1 glutathione S-transferase [Leptospira broomii serovar Hurstbridge str. 5399]